MPAPTLQTRAAELIERLKAGYEINRPSFDFYVAQYLSGINNEKMRQEVIRQAAGETKPLKQCGIFVVANCLKAKFSQLNIF